ncbi:MAG: hypothetical protein E7650_07760 [Ruminococcaceae bacterium]|nr:hypothetical protein [Oscillospiraceae bacterium]
MKKSVVILIAIIYVASIALVSFFGLQYQNFFEIVYTEQIELLGDNIKTNDKGEKYVVILPDEQGNYAYQIQYRVHPDNATNSKVDFIYDHEKADKSSISVDENGVVTFSKRGGTLKVKLVAKDGSGASATITLITW